MLQNCEPHIRYYIAKTRSVIYAIAAYAVLLSGTPGCTARAVSSGADFARLVEMLESGEIEINDSVTDLPHLPKPEVSASRGGFGQYVFIAYSHGETHLHIYVFEQRLIAAQMFRFDPSQRGATDSKLHWYFFDHERMGEFVRAWDK